MNTYIVLTNQPTTNLATKMPRTDRTLYQMYIRVSPTHVEVIDMYYYYATGHIRPRKNQRRQFIYAPG